MNIHRRRCTFVFVFLSFCFGLRVAARFKLDSEDFIDSLADFGIHVYLNFSRKTFGFVLDRSARSEDG